MVLPKGVKRVFRKNTLQESMAQSGLSKDDLAQLKSIQREIKPKQYTPQKAMARLSSSRESLVSAVNLRSKNSKINSQDITKMAVEALRKEGRLPERLHRKRRSAPTLPHAS